MSDPFDVDVVIIGAGFSGLTVATELSRQGISFVVLEARGHIGGKTESVHDGLGRLVDTGGQFANDDMTEVLALARDAGATRVDAVHPGRPVTVPHSPHGDPWADAEALLATLRAADLGDARSISQWADATTAATSVREAIRSLVDGGTCNDSRTIPVSYLAQLNERTPSTEEELQCWFVETMHQLALHLAARFTDHIRVECPAHSVHVHDASVDVVALDQVWHARQVVVAVPPTAYSSIRFTPGLPDDFSAAAAAFAPGIVLKYLVGYPAPFWLLDGRNGIGQFLDPPGVYFADVSLPNAPTLVGFVGGTTAAEWTRHTQAQRRDALLHHAAAAFGAEALRPVTFLERLWGPDEWGGGGYSNVLTTHAPDAADTLAAGLHLVTFASTELSPTFPGYVEGAIRAGTAAARHVVRLLGIA